MVHLSACGYEFRGKEVRPSKDGTKTYLNLVFEDPQDCDRLKVRVPEERREDADVRNLAKGDVCDFDVAIWTGTWTSFVLDSDIAVSVPED